MLGKKQRSKKIIRESAKNCETTSDLCQNMNTQTDDYNGSDHLPNYKNSNVDSCQRSINDFCLNGNSKHQKDLVRKFKIKSILKRIPTFFFRLLWITIRMSFKLFSYLKFSRVQTCVDRPLNINDENSSKQESEQYNYNIGKVALRQPPPTQITQHDKLQSSPLNSRKYQLKKRKQKISEGNNYYGKLNFVPLKQSNNLILNEVVDEAVETRNHDISLESIDGSCEAELKENLAITKKVSEINYDKDLKSKNCEKGLIFLSGPLFTTPTKYTSKGKRRKQFSPTHDEFKKPRNANANTCNRKLNDSNVTKSNDLSTQRLTEIDQTDSKATKQVIEDKKHLSPKQNENNKNESFIPEFTPNESSFSLSKLESNCPLPFRSSSAPPKKEGPLPKRPTASKISIGDFITPAKTVFGSQRKKNPPVGKILPAVKEPENRGAKYGPIGSRPENFSSARVQDPLRTSIYYSEDLLNHPAFSETYFNLGSKLNRTDKYLPFTHYANPTFAPAACFLGTNMYQTYPYVYHDQQSSTTINNWPSSNNALQDDMRSNYYSKLYMDSHTHVPLESAENERNSNEVDSLLFKSTKEFQAKSMPNNTFDICHGETEVSKPESTSEYKECSHVPTKNLPNSFTRFSNGIWPSWVTYPPWILVGNDHSTSVHNKKENECSFSQNDLGQKSPMNPEKLFLSKMKSASISSIWNNSGELSNIMKQEEKVNQKNESSYSLHH